MRAVELAPESWRRRRVTYENLKLSTNFAVFGLFFGVATLEAFATRHWLKAGFWLAIGIVFLVADNLKSKNMDPLQ